MRLTVLVILGTLLFNVTDANAIPINVGNPAKFSYTSLITGPYIAGQYDIVFSVADPHDEGEQIRLEIQDPGMNPIGVSLRTRPSGSGPNSGSLGLAIINIASVTDSGFVEFSMVSGSVDITSIGLFLITTTTNARFDITGNLIENSVGVPEPTTLLLLGLGLAGLGFARRRLH